MNPYALGMRIFHYIEELADKGRYSIEFKRLLDARERERFDANTGSGKAFVYKVRENLNDFMFINTFVDQDFINRTKAAKQEIIARCFLTAFIIHPTSALIRKNPKTATFIYSTTSRANRWLKNLLPIR
jgi:spore cortex formation protein SpoVR/YcgB (stage V sporulation)